MKATWNRIVQTLKGRPSTPLPNAIIWGLIPTPPNTTL